VCWSCWWVRWWGVAGCCREPVTHASYCITHREQEEPLPIASDRVLFSEDTPGSSTIHPHHQHNSLNNAHKSRQYLLRFSG
jgi:hypothetical protein